MADPGKDDATIEPLDPTIPARLADPRAYPRDRSARAGVRSIQTHISHVFLTGDTVYKLHKAVDLGFLRFTTREERNADSLRELHLNRRLAPDVYLGVAPIESTAGSLRVGETRERLASPLSDGSVPEHCVVMRRLPDGWDALTLLEEGRLEPSDIDRIAERVASFHRENRLATPAPFTTPQWFEHVTGPALRNFDAMARSDTVVPAAAIADARQETARAATRLADRFEMRRRQGRAVEGHGDLHLQHIFLEPGRRVPSIIDCITFNDDLRRIDAAAEVAFPAMDLTYRGAVSLADRFLRRYAALTDDFDLYDVVDFFISYRAGVRAKVATLAALEAEIEPAQREAAVGSAERHLAFARACLEPRPLAPLVLVGGAVGTGKSSVADVLADRTGGVVITSDRTRKHLLDIEPSDHRHADAADDAYSEERRDRVYAALLERAGPVVRSGRVAILDATYHSRAQRSVARDHAHALGIPVCFVEARCNPEEALRRVAERAQRGDDPSDAGPEIAKRSHAGFEPLDEWPAADHLTVRTDEAGWRDRAWQLPGALAAFLDRKR